MRKPAPAPAAAAPGTDATGETANAPATPTTAESPNSAPPSVLSPVSPANAMPPAVPASVSAPQQSAMASDVDVEDSETSANDRHASHKKLHVPPFGNGPVAHGNVLRLKMDGAIEKIEGAQQATGFTVVVPARRSLEAAGPLAARDGRIASIRVSNDTSGAELTVAFKDGVPNYQVRAHGDVLEIVLAAPGSLAAPERRGSDAKHDAAQGAPSKVHPKRNKK
jgi:hypothetical protein